jgi:hypothetical protein
MMAKQRKATKAPKKKAKRGAAATAKRPDGSISSGIYNTVEKLVADGNMTRTAAFRQIAKETGRKEGTVSVNYYYAAKKRGAKGRPPTKKAAARAVKPSKPAGSVSAMIYDAIEKLIAGGKMTRAAAFRQHAKQTGRKEGTVAVNYYYAAKKRGTKLLKRRGRPKAVHGARRGGRSSSIESVLKSLADLIRTQESELRALRQEGERFAAIRRLFP